MSSIDKALCNLEEMDSDALRSGNIMGIIVDALIPYRQILEEKEKQLVQSTMERFFHRKARE
jgi:hypothetical protein